MAEKRRDEPHSIAVYGNGAYYADQAGDASRYSATRDGRIAKADFVCPADHLLDVDDLIIQHALPVQELARRHLSYLQIEMLPGSIGEPIDEALIADILETASGWHLLRAVNGACHSYPVGERSTDVDEGFSPRVAASREVQQVLSSAGIRAIRFRDTADGYGSSELGPFYFIVDRAVLQPARLDAHFSLQFADYATADEAEAARSLNHEWRFADDAGRDAVCAVVGLCRRGGAHTTLPFGEGGAYAYPHPGGGIAWGLEGRYSVVARGVQRLPADARPGIHDLEDLRAITENWREVGDRGVEDPTRAKDLLAAAHWHHTAASAWLQAERLSDAELVEAQAYLDVLATVLDAVERAVMAHATDAAWVTGFDAAGWPNVPHQSLAGTLTALMLQRCDDAAPLNEGEPSQQQDNRRQEGRVR